MFEQFSVGPSRGLLLAQSLSTPRFMIVSGPNGAGKSTMLELLHKAPDQAQPETHIMYVSPNRPWRKSDVSAMTVLGMGTQNYRSMIESQAPPQFQYGPPRELAFLNYNPGSRGRDFVDDVQSLVKTHIISLERRRQVAVTAMVDSGLRGDDLNFDAYLPMRSYISKLLPHLEFVRVDVSQEQSQRVVFRKLDALEPVELELDDLSSGEKAVVALMFPFIEAQMERLISTRGTSIRDTVIPTVLIDEPELHLHPALQMNLVSYMRELAVENQAQFILCTHSTTIIDSAGPDELFVLAPPVLTGANQLLSIADTASRLESVRELTGSAYTITRCRPIVFLEGEQAGGKTPADHRIVEILVPESKGWVLIPAHGREQAVRASTDLRDPALTGLPGLSVFALVDRDQGQYSDPEWVIQWDVSMQENLLLDCDAIWSMIEPHLSSTSILPKSRNETEQLLLKILHDRRNREIEIAVRSNIVDLIVCEGVHDLDSYTKLDDRLLGKLEVYRQRIGHSEGVRRAIEDATDKIDLMLQDPSRAMSAFHGKEVIDSLFRQIASGIGSSSKAAFAYNLAAAVSRTNSDRFRSIISAPVRKIMDFVPNTLVVTLQEISEEPAYADVVPILTDFSTARHHWEVGAIQTIDRVRRRADVVAVGRRLTADGRTEIRDRLMNALVQYAAS